MDTKLSVTKEELEDMYWGRRMSQREIAVELGCVRGAVRNLMNKFGIKARHEYNKRTDITKELLEDMYWNKGMSQLEIARKLGFVEGGFGSGCCYQFSINLRSLVNSGFVFHIGRKQKLLEEYEKNVLGGM